MITAEEIRNMSDEERAAVSRDMAKNFWKSPFFKLMAVKWILLIALRIAWKRSRKAK